MPKIAVKVSKNSKNPRKNKKNHKNTREWGAGLPIGYGWKFTTHRKYSNKIKFRKSESSGGDQEGSDHGMD